MEAIWEVLSWEGEKYRVLWAKRPKDHAIFSHPCLGTERLAWMSDAGEPYWKFEVQRVKATRLDFERLEEEGWVIEEEDAWWKYSRGTEPTAPKPQKEGRKMGKTEAFVIEQLEAKGYSQVQCDHAPGEPYYVRAVGNGVEVVEVFETHQAVRSWVGEVELKGEDTVDEQEDAESAESSARFLETVLAAIADTKEDGEVVRTLFLEYADEEGKITQRVVRPFVVFQAESNGHLVMRGFCTLRRAFRSFRIDRIKKVAPHSYMALERLDDGKTRLYPICYNARSKDPRIIKKSKGWDTGAATAGFAPTPIATVLRPTAA